MIYPLSGVKKIYLDLCSLQRPLDSKSHLRIVLESEAVLGLIKLCELKQLELVSSQSLLFEAEQNSNLVRKVYISEMLARASIFIYPNDNVENRSREFIKLGIKPMDALHLASAVEARSDYFCTCDDRFLKRAKVICTAPTRIFSPIELIVELEL
jgi:predicted nucleic acid-binding protein